SALGAGTLTLNGGTKLQLAGNTGINFGNNTTVAGDATIESDRLAAGAGVTHTLGTLSIGGNTLILARDASITSGTAGLTVGVTIVSRNLTTTNDAVSFAGPVTLTGGGTTTVSAGTANVTFGGTIEGPSALMVNSGGQTTFNGVVGGTTPLASLTTDAPGT